MNKRHISHKNNIIMKKLKKIKNKKLKISNGIYMERKKRLF